MTIELPEPVAWMERQMLNTGWSDWYHRNPRRKSDPLEITVDQIHFQFSPVYTREQMLAFRDAVLEEAQEACKAADLKADAKGIRLTLTAANQIIGALKGT